MILKGVNLEASFDKLKNTLMNCEKFMELDNVEQSLYVGQIVHSCISNNEIFEMGKKIIELGHLKGLFERTTIMPHVSQPKDIMEES